MLLFLQRQTPQNNIFGQLFDRFFMEAEFEPGGGGGGDSYMKQTGMLVVSPRGVNFGFWTRLGCPGQSANI